MRGLTKRFGPTLAVDALDLDVPRGSFFGLVGPNGAGKTTTLSMVTGLLRPDAGSVEVLGHDVWADPVAAKQLIGVLPDGLRLFDRLTGLQLVTYAGLLRGMDRREVVAARAGELLAALGLADAGGKLVVDYSAGMTKKITLACALVHAPAPARARRAVRGGRPGLGRDHPPASSPASSTAAAPSSSPATSWTSSSASAPRRRSSPRARPRRGAPRRRPRGGSASRSGSSTSSAGPTEVEGLAWLRTSSD